jgi:hypothetical protein
MGVAMQRSRNLALMFILGAVLVGAVLGFTADRIMVRGKICAPTKSAQDYRKTFYDDIGLTGEQREAWDSLLDERSRASSPYYAQADSVRAAYREKLLALLSDEQRQVLDERERKAREDREKRNNQKRQQ